MRAARAARAAFVGLVVSSVAALAVGLTSCSSVPDSGRYTAVLQPDYGLYRANVDLYLRRRCGTLDCHGQSGRAYRIYGREGYRLYTIDDGGLVSGNQPTTDEETRANFQAIVALEPEEMSRAMAAGGTDEAIKKLLFIRKPLRMERHKGGPAMAEDDPGYKCVVSWLRVPVIKDDGSPTPPETRTMSPRAIQDCQEAASYP